LSSLLQRSRTRPALARSLSVIRATFTD
jgi:hypothetical protein